MRQLQFAIIFEESTAQKRYSLPHQNLSSPYANSFDFKSLNAFINSETNVLCFCIKGKFSKKEYFYPVISKFDYVTFIM